MPNRPIPAAEQQKIAKLWVAGYTATQIANKLGLNLRTVRKYRNTLITVGVLLNFGTETRVFNRTKQNRPKRWWGKTPRRASRHKRCPHGHDMTPDNTILTKHGSERCKTCYRLDQRARQRFKRSGYGHPAAQDTDSNNPPGP